MTALELNEYLCCLRANNVMAANFKLEGLDMHVTFGPEPAPMDSAVPGGWKSMPLVEGPSDPDDPDPLKLGTLDNFDDVEVTL